MGTSLGGTQGPRKSNKKNSKLGFGTRFGMILRVLAGKRYRHVCLHVHGFLEACFFATDSTCSDSMWRKTTIACFHIHDMLAGQIDNLSKCQNPGPVVKLGLISALFCSRTVNSGLWTPAFWQFPSSCKILINNMLYNAHYYSLINDKIQVIYLYILAKIPDGRFFKLSQCQIQISVSKRQ